MIEENLQNLGIDELELLNQQLTTERLAIKAQQRAIAVLLDQKRNAQALQADIDALQNKHGVQLLAPGAIASSEALGKP